MGSAVVGNHSKPYYVILTGSKNNAGDYLIKYRAKKLFLELRPDRDVVDIDGWKKFDKVTLELVNNAEALILMGGPSLQKHIYPGIYPLVDSLEDITTKIILMGVGWKSLNGAWEDSQDYPFTSKSKLLLKRINEDGKLQSVRDFHTANVLFRNGIKNVVMTGCPATYSLEHIGSNFQSPKNIKKVAFSLGVSFLDSDKLLLQMKKSIIEAKKAFENQTFQVVFHHSTQTDFLNTHNAKEPHLAGHLQFIQWLNSVNIDYVDISGSAENLMDYYQTCDLHVGYRVHAHIFMTSVSKPSILIAEDGRGRALKDVFGGIVLDAFTKINQTFLAKVLRRLNISSGITANPYATEELLEQITYEIKNAYPRMKSARLVVNHNYAVMEKFMKSLP